MINFFLKARAWHLFAIVFIIPMLFYGYLMSEMMSEVFNAMRNETKEINFFDDYFWVFVFIFVLVFFTIFGWQYSVGIGIQKEIPEELRMNTILFQLVYVIIALVFLIYWAAFIYFNANVINNSDFGITLPNSRSAPLMAHQLDYYTHPYLTVLKWLFYVMLACLSYAHYFIAKTVKTFELKRKVKFSDFLTEFIFLWFFLIAVWIIQPLLNTLFEYPNKKKIIDELGE